MGWEVEGTDEFAEWFHTLDETDRAAIADRVGLLADIGPTLGRPAVDSIKASRHKNMKELRASTLRVLFIFDPTSTAILLIGGDKNNTGQDGTTCTSHVPTTSTTHTSRNWITKGRPAMAKTTKFSEILARNPVSGNARTEARLANLAADLGLPLAELRRLNDTTQVELARRLAVTQPSVSDVERNANASIPAVRRYVEALGAHLELTAVFDDGRRVALHI